MKTPLPWLSPPLHIAHTDHDHDHEAAHESVGSSAAPQKQTTKGPIFRHQREASAIELFYDLFFVANLASVTAENEIVDGATLKRYLGYFTLVWFTWLQTILFDVRFSTESVFHHVHKAISYAIMIGFVICAACYNTSHVRSTIDGFRAMSLVLMVSRLVLAMQYSVTYWYVRQYDKTRVPFLCTIGCLCSTSLAYFGLFWGFKRSPESYIAWYVLSLAEGATIIAISCKWRVVSFKRTHLIERLGLLTLIVMGEGILGLSRSTYRLFQTLRRPTAENFGQLICAMVLVYLIFMLYFGHAEHDKFGSIRQQIWMILHFPLHVAILLTEEGSSFLILSRVISHIISYWDTLYPLQNSVDWNNFFSQYDSVDGVVGSITGDLQQLFHVTFRDQEALLTMYNYTRDITAIQNIGHPFNTTEWQVEASVVIDQLWKGMEDAVYSSFGVDGLVTQDHRPPPVEAASSPQHIMEAVFLYFFFAAGGLLFVLSLMTIFAKKIPTKDMWLSVGIKVLIGFLLLVPLTANWISTDASEAFYLSPWTTVVVMFGYLTVVIADHLIAWFCHRRRRHNTS